MSGKAAKVFKDSFLVVSATVVDNGVFFIINILIARYLSIQHYGEYTTAMGYATFFSLFTNIGINQALIRSISIDSDNKSRNFGSVILIKTFLSAVIYFIMGVSLYFTNYPASTVYLSLILGIVRIGTEYLSAFYALYDAEEKFFSATIFKTVSGLSLLAITLAVIVAGGGYYSFAVSRSIIVIFFIVLIFILTSRQFRVVFNIEDVKSFTVEAVPFTLSSLFSNTYTRTNIVILSLIHGTIYSGIFQNGYMFFSTLAFVPNSFSRVLLPYLYKLRSGDSSGELQRIYDLYSRYLGIISFYLMMVFIIFRRELIIGIFGITYSDSIPVLVITSMALPFMFTMSGTVITSLDRQSVRTRIEGYGTVFSLLANIVLIYLYKADGAAWATVATFLFIFIFNCAYLSIKNYVNHLYTYKTYGILVLIVLGVIVFQDFVSSDVLVKDFLQASIIYLILVLIFLVRIDDLRFAGQILKKTKNN